MKRTILLGCALGISLLSLAQSENLVLSSYDGRSSYSALGSITLKPGFHIPSGKTVQLSIQSSPNVQNGFSTNQNYIVRRSFRAPVKVSELSAARSVAEENQSVQYFDGLGRPLQNVQVMASPQHQDVVEHFQYDGFGRQTHQYLPYIHSTGNGSYKTGGATSVINYYKKTSGTDIEGVVRTNYPMAITVFENSPLNRVLAQGSAGLAWQPAASRGTSGRTVLSDYGTNVASGVQAVKMWTLNTSGTGATVSGNYAAGKLYRTIVKDENWTSGLAGTAEEYRDFQDRVILKRVWKSESVALDTYYLYNDLGDLCYVIPPMYKTNSITDNNADFNELIYAYKYDARRRLVEKKLPGKGWEYMVYNKNDQLVLMQDAVQRAGKHWSYTRYNAFGEVVSTGIYTNTNQTTRQQMQTLADAAARQWEERGGAADYPGTSFPVNGNGGTVKPLVVNYYDDYTFSGASGLKVSSGTITTSKLKGVLTGSKVYKSDGSSFLLSVNYYDERGRLLESVSQNHLGGIDRVSNSYLFSGELAQSRREHTGSTASGAPKTTLLTKHSYDHMGRLEQTRKQVNAQAEIIQSQLEYNAIGQLRRKKLHSENDSGNFLTTLGYTYNERGWTTQIASEAYNQTLKYQDGTTAQYNGNISEQLWRHGSDGVSTFKYTYDALNRLTQGSSTGVRVMSETLTYDDMGNIKSLKRDAGTPAQYTYLNAGKSNRLGSLKGGIAGTGTLSYSYDGNGNVTKDRTGMTFAYNHLNLPQTVTKTGTSVTYDYDALGTRLRKYSKVGTVETERDYIGGIEYKKVGTGAKAIERIATEEGYLQNSNGSYAFHYTITDHLGNVRAVIKRGSSATAREVVQKQDYYPFGKTKSIVTGGINNYLYNGKERQAEVGDQLDYGARFYDAEIGRWNVVDPLAEVQPNKTPYHFVSNNPINRVDPTGMLDNPIYDEDGNFLGTDDKGLQGKAIVMNKDTFTQGMSHEDALSHSLGAEGLNEGGLDKLLSHKSTLSSRVDWKGYVTFGEAIDHYHYGNGEPLYVDLSKINFKSSRLSVDDFTSRGTNSLSVNFFMADTHPFNSNILWYPGESNLGNVFGTLRVNLESTNGSISLQNYERYGGGFDRFDFNRADQFIADRLRRGGSPTPYNFYGYGKGSINLTKPKVHTLDNPGIKKPGEF